jgi:hypothetical protein
MRQVEGSQFCASCGTKLVGAVPQEPPLNEPARLQSSTPAISSKDSIQGDEILAQSNKALDSGVSEVKVLDAGDKFVLSGAQPVEVDKILQKFLKRGAKLITPVSRVGNRWAAACSVPPTTKSMDETQTLSLLVITKAVADAKPDEPDDGCRVEEFGFKRIVYGPSRLAVQFRLEYLKQFGAESVGEIEEQGEEWVAVVDMGSAKNTGYRW